MKLGVPGFVAERLTQARDLRKLTQTDLARQIGKSRQQISRYEQGIDSPTFDVLHNIADVLDRPAPFFFRSMPPKEVVHFRRLKSVTRAELAHVELWRERLEDTSLLVSGYIHLPELNLPPDLPPIMDSARFDDYTVENIAMKVRSHWGLDEKPVPNMVRIVEKNGFLVSRYSFDVERIDGLSFRQHRLNRPVIALNAEKSNYFRSRFDCAHELAHHVLHQDITIDDLKDPVIYERVEGQAHRFASAFLLPEKAFLEDVFSYSLSTLEHFKPKWGVSISAMIYRLKDLKAIDEHQSSLMRMYLSRKKWNRREPLDLETQPEKPALLPQAMRALVTKAGFDKQDVLRELQLEADEVERVANVPDGFFTTPDGDRWELRVKKLSDVS